MRTGIVAFLMGNVSLLYWPFFPDFHLVLIGSGILLILTGILYKSRHHFVSLAAIFLPLCFFCLYFLFGFIYTALYIKHNVPVLELGQLEGTTIRLKGAIASIPYNNNKAQRFELIILAREVLDNSGNKVWDSSFTGKVRLAWYRSDRPLAIGQRWQMDVRLKKPNGLLNPGSFDYEQWLYQNRISATGYVRDGVRLSQGQAESDSVFTRLSGLRQRIADTMDSALANYPYKGMVKALSIGYRHDMAARHWDVFMRTGTNHLIAISGLHIGLMATLVWFIVHALWRSNSAMNLKIPAYYVASILALIAALFYAALAGFAIPTQRALIMLAVVFLAIMFNRNFLPSYVLSLALILVLLIDPLSPLAPGFWLSFGAVTVILFSVSSRIALSSNKLSKWLQLSRIQWSVFVGLLPLMLLLFHQLSLSSPLANLFAVPLMTVVIVPLTLFSSMMLFIFEPLALFLFSLLQWPLDGLFWVLQHLSRWSNSVYYLPAMTWQVLVLAVIACLWLLLPKGWHGRWLGLLILLPVLFIDSPRPEAGEVQMTVLDVGQGLSVVIRTRNHALVYDTGDKYSEQFNMADVAIIPFLRLKGIKELDTLVVSHSDRDHAGSISELLQQIPVKAVISGEADKITESLLLNSYRNDVKPTNSIKQCRKGQQWQWDNVRFKVLSPQWPEKERKANNRSCVILVTTVTNDTILLTGDIEKKTEKQLLNDYPELKARILQVPHHGSKTSSSSDFLKQLEPEIALFSYGYRNRFKHPAGNVLQRYKQKRIKLFSTSNGAIDIKRNITNNSLLVKQYRFENRRFWHREPEKL